MNIGITSKYDYMTLKENGINNNDSCIPSFLWETIPELTIREKKRAMPKMYSGP